MRLQDFGAKPPTDMKKRNPTPFAGNHVVDVEAVKRFVSSDTKRFVSGEDLPAKNPFADPEDVDDEPVF